MNELELLTKEWLNLTDGLLRLELIDINRFKELARETHTLLHEYSVQNFVPKEACQLLLELQWFSWWVADVEASPMHGLYQEIGDTMFALIGHFFGYSPEYESIEPFLVSL